MLFPAITTFVLLTRPSIFLVNNYILPLFTLITNMTDHSSSEVEKLIPHIIVEIIEYMPNAVVSKTIIKKTTGNVIVTSVDKDEELAEKISPYDTYVQIIDGAAVIYINDMKYKLRLGEGIIIPAHAKHHFNADVQFKMISTVIKSGYEE
jgi:quercetin dioxygenase-like cupin family protein